MSATPRTPLDAEPVPVSPSGVDAPAPSVDGDTDAGTDRHWHPVPEHVASGACADHPGGRVSRILLAVLIAPIEAYRRWISPALPPRCRFYPSCSAYALEALRTRGPVAGMLLAGWRVMRCHPFHPGGYDPVPPPHGAAWPWTRRARNRRPSGAAR